MDDHAGPDTPSAAGAAPPPPAPASFTDFESFPLTRPEYISAIVHFYRGEMYRSQTWRTRLDTTTNWAVVTTAGMISFAFSDARHSPVTLILAALLVTIFLMIEARRYRYFSVYRARVRMIEENFYLPLIRRSLASPKGDWRDLVATDLDVPTFKTTFLEAVLFRLKRNYAWLYAIILATWFSKVTMHPTATSSLAEAVGRMKIGPIPAGIVLTAMVAAAVVLVVLTLAPVGRRASTDEIRGVERERSHWKV